MVLAYMAFSTPITATDALGLAVAAVAVALASARAGSIGSLTRHWRVVPKASEC